MFIATYTDYSDSADWHGRLLGTFGTKEEAEQAVGADMAGTARFFGDDVIVRNDTHEVWKSDGEIGEIGCIWDIYEI